MGRRVRADYLFAEDFNPVKDTATLNAILLELYNRLATTQNLNPPTAAVYRSTAQSITNNTETSITFDTVSWDTDSMFDAAAPTRVTVHEAGLYIIHAGVEWNSVASATRRYIGARLNGGTLIAVDGYAPSATASHTHQNVDTIYPLNVNDFLELRVYQNTGAALNVNRATDFSPVLRVMKVGEL